MVATKPISTFLSKYIGKLADKLDDFGRETADEVKGLEKLEKPVIQNDALLVPRLNETETKSLDDGLKSIGYNGPGVKLGRIGAIFDEQDGYSLKSEGSYEKMLTELRAENKELFDFARRKRVLSMDDLIQLAHQKGLKNIVKKIFIMPTDQALNAEDTVGILLMVKRYVQEISYGQKKMSQMPDTEATRFMGDGVKKERRKLAKKIQNISGQLVHLTSRFSGGISNSARSLAVLTKADELAGARVRKIEAQAQRIIDEQDDDMIELQAVFLANMDQDEKVSFLGKLWEKGAKSANVLQDLYLSGLLSSFVTDAVNIGSNAGFQALRFMENGLAGAVGETREALDPILRPGKKFNYEDRAYVEEAFSGVAGQVYAIPKAFTLMMKAGITGEASDLNSKLDMRLPAIGNSQSLQKVLQQFSEGDRFNAFINIFSILIRLPARGLIMEDEVFKAIIREKTKYQIATRRGLAKMREMGDIKLKDGQSKYTRKQRLLAFQNEVAHTLIDPSGEVLDEMQKVALQETFQGPVRGVFQNFSPIFNNFAGRVLLNPFYKSVSNIYSEFLDRSFNFVPLAKSIAKGEGRDFDEAVAKLAMGWGLMLYGTSLVRGWYNNDIIVTGTGPTDKRTQNIITRGAKVDKGSVGIERDNEPGEYDQYNFRRFEPMGMLMMLGADFNNYMEFREPIDAETTTEKALANADRVFNTAWLAISQHSLDLPFVAGLSELNQYIMRPWETGDKWSSKIGEYLTKRGTMVAGEALGQIETYGTASTGYWLRSYMENNYPEYAEKFPLVGTNALLRNFERVYDPQSENVVRLSDEDLEELDAQRIEDVNPAMRGYYLGINRLKAGHPLYAPDIAPGYNFWAEKGVEIEPEYIKRFGKARFFWNPIRITKGGYDELDEEIIRISEATNGETFMYHPRNLTVNLNEIKGARPKMETIRMTSDEINRYIWLVNNMDTDGNIDGNAELGIEPKGAYNPQNNLVNRLNILIQGGDPVFGDTYTTSNYEDRFYMMNTILRDYRKQAKDYMIENEPRMIDILSDEKINLTINSDF